MEHLNQTKAVHTCMHCANRKLLANLYQICHQLAIGQEEILQRIRRAEEEQTVYRDAKYLLDRVGISRSTLLREQHKGAIAVAYVKNGKKYFRDQDVERLRRVYWGR